jgi:hypothetical protein
MLTGRVILFLERAFGEAAVSLQEELHTFSSAQFANCISMTGH